jgi:hypothetical protein
MKLAARIVGTHHEERSNHHDAKAAEIIWKHNLSNRSPIDNRHFYPQITQICADFFESRLLGAGRPLCLRFPVASLDFSAEGAKHSSPGQVALKARAAPGRRPSKNCTL